MLWDSSYKRNLNNYLKEQVVGKDRIRKGKHCLLFKEWKIFLSLLNWEELFLIVSEKPKIERLGAKLH